MPARLMLGPEKLQPNGVPVFICGDDEGAKSIVTKLAEDLGFIGMDSGTLANAGLVDGAAHFLRMQIVAMGLGPSATLLIRILN